MSCVADFNAKTMMTWESFVAKAKMLPPEKQRAILDPLEALWATSEGVAPGVAPPESIPDSMSAKRISEKTEDRSGSRLKTGVARTTHAEECDSKK